MNYKINIQIACEEKIPVTAKTIRQWLELTLRTTTPLLPTSGGLSAGSSETQRFLDPADKLRDVDVVGNIRPILKLAAVREVQEETARRTGVDTLVHENSSTVSTQQFSTEVGFRKRSIERAELTVRLTTIEEITTLNTTYRHQPKPTNVLAFPSQLPDTITLKYPLLGDLVICPAILKKEHIEQKRPLIAHWAHIVIHGALHLLGFDHIDDKDTVLMQTEEIKLLAELGFENPYHHEENNLE